MHAIETGVKPPTPKGEHLNKIRTAMTGEHGRSSKLKESQVREIKSMLRSGGRVREIARIIGISHSVVSDIKNGKLWVEVE